MCENCIHKDVCRYKTEFENLKNDFAKITPTWDPDRYIIRIECRKYRRDAAAVLSSALRENLGAALREKEET